MAKKIWVREIQNRRELEADPELRCVAAPDGFEVERKGVTVTRDEGSRVQIQVEDRKWRVDTMELKEARIGEVILAKFGSTKLGSDFWPAFEVLSGPTVKL